MARNGCRALSLRTRDVLHGGDGLRSTLGVPRTLWLSGDLQRRRAQVRFLVMFSLFPFPIPFIFFPLRPLRRISLPEARYVDLLHPSQIRAPHWLLRTFSRPAGAKQTENWHEKAHSPA
jgi:hypothetical protein